MFTDLLTWSLTKLNFPFYNFSMIYHDFPNIQSKKIKNKKTKPPSKPLITGQEGKMNGFKS